MKTFREFITEVYDPDVVGKSQIRKQGEGGRVGRMRKQSEPEKRRMKAVGGGKMVPASKRIKIVRILEHNVRHQTANNNPLKQEVQQESNYRQENNKQKARRERKAGKVTVLLEVVQLNQSQKI